MRRRAFISLLGGSAVWPLATRAQESERIRRVGVLMNLAASDQVGRARLAAFVQGLQELGWSTDRNVRIDARWGAGDADRYRRFAAELVALAPDVILGASGATVPPLLLSTRSVPIVFALTPDPVGAGFVNSLARPGGNATGFTNIESSLAGKWLELLKEIAPAVTRAAVLRDTSDPLGAGQFSVIQSVAPSFSIQLRPVDMHDADEMERAVTAFTDASDGGIIVLSSALATVHRDLVIKLAARYSLPAVYPTRFHVDSGGLISYGPDTIDPYRQAVRYVDRIFKGEKPADLPVQAPTKYELLVNLKTAAALGLKVPPALLARADEVIE